jgi:hypothetical protein
MIKALKKLGIESMYLNITKVTYDKPIANIILKPFPLKSGDRESTLTAVIQYSTRIPSQSKKIEERNKRDSNREGRSQIISICR